MMNQQKDWMKITAFGHTFVVLSELANDLLSLQREGAIYAHFWDECAEAFRYYKIPFLPAEIVQFVEAHVAMQQFRQAIESGATFDEALNRIWDPQIAQRVRQYGNYGRTAADSPTTIDLRGCPASFYPPELEALVCGLRPERYELLPKLGEADTVNLLIRMIDSFPVVAGYLRKRGGNRPAYLVESEQDVRDLLFSCVRSVFDDARMEDWAPKHAGGAKRIDVVVPSAGAVIEVKYVRDAAHVRRVADELKIDIESYHTHPNCRSLLALVYDPQQHVVDPAALSNELSGYRVKHQTGFDVKVMVRR